MLVRGSSTVIIELYAIFFIVRKDNFFFTKVLADINGKATV